MELQSSPPGFSSHSPSATRLAPRPLPPRPSRSDSLAQARAALVARLRSRQAEIERAVLIRVHAISSNSSSIDAEYLHGLRSAVAAAIDYGLTVVELGEGEPPAIPLALVTQARLSARLRINLDTVLRRYIAGSNLLRDFLMSESIEDELLSRTALPGLLRSHSVLLEKFSPQSVMSTRARARYRSIRPPISAWPGGCAGFWPAS